jgi:hypothetical protein
VIEHVARGVVHTPRSQDLIPGSGAATLYGPSVASGMIWTARQSLAAVGESDKHMCPLADRFIAGGTASHNTTLSDICPGSQLYRR